MSIHVVFNLTKYGMLANLSYKPIVCTFYGPEMYEIYRTNCYGPGMNEIYKEIVIYLKL